METGRMIRRLIVLVLLFVFQPLLGQVNTDRVMKSGFEAVPLGMFPRIEFVGDSSLVFSATGQSRSVSVRVFDAEGTLVPDPAVVWQSTMPANASVAALGPGSAVVQSVAAWTGSIAYTASYPALGVEVQGGAAFATPGAKTVLIDSAWVQAILGDRAATHHVVLEHNATTDSLQVEDIVVSGDYAGIVAQVVSIQVGATSIDLEVLPASLTDAFENVEFAGQGEPLSVTVELVGGSAALTVRSQRSGAIVQRASLPYGDVLSLLECSGDLGAGIEVDGLSLEWSFVPRAGLRIEGFKVVDFLVSVEGGVGIDASASMKAVAPVKLSGECKAELPSIALAAIPVGPFFISPRVVPVASVSASASASVVVMDFLPATLKRAWSFRAGVRYTDVDGWNTIAEGGAEQYSADSDPLAFDGELAMELKAEAGVEGHAAFYLGAPELEWDLVDMKLVELGGGPFKEWQLDTPVSPDKPGYKGPEVESGVEASAHLSFKKELFTGAVAKLLPISLDADFELTFLSGRFVYDRLPSVTGGIECSTNCAALVPGTGTLTLRLQANTTETGTADFWIGKKNATSLSLFASTPFSQGVGQVESVLPATLGLGEFDVFSRLRLDGEAYAFTQFVPLAKEGAVGSFSLVEYHSLLVSKEQDGTGTALALASVTSAPVGIDCGVTCAAQFVSGTQVALTAADAPPWIFARWGQGGACAGSTNRTCVVDMVADRTALAVFAKPDPTPTVLQNIQVFSCFLHYDWTTPQTHCDQTPDPGAGFFVIHEHVENHWGDAYAYMTLDGQVLNQSGQASIEATVDASATSQYFSRGELGLSAQYGRGALITSQTLPFGTPVSVRATFHVNLHYTRDVTLSEPFVQWSAGWPTLYASVAAGGGNQGFGLANQNFPGDFAPVDSTRSESVDLIVQSTVGETIPLATYIYVDSATIVAARAHFLGGLSVQVSGPYLMESNGLDVQFSGN